MAKWLIWVFFENQAFPNFQTINQEKIEICKLIMYDMLVAAQTE